MWIYGSYTLDKSLNEFYEMEISQAKDSKGTITYQSSIAKWLVRGSGIKDRRIFYQKTLYRHAIFKTLRIEYDGDQTFDAITASIARVRARD